MRIYYNTVAYDKENDRSVRVRLTLLGAISVKPYHLAEIEFEDGVTKVTQKTETQTVFMQGDIDTTWAIEAVVSLSRALRAHYSRTKDIDDTRKLALNIALQSQKLTFQQVNTILSKTEIEEVMHCADR
jgi:hypothetical protein